MLGKKIKNEELGEQKRKRVKKKGGNLLKTVTQRHRHWDIKTHKQKGKGTDQQRKRKLENRRETGEEKNYQYKL